MKHSHTLAAVAVAGIAWAGLTGPSPAVAQDSITIASWGGAYSMSQRKAYYEPFMKETGITVLEDEWNGSMAQIRAQVGTGNYKWHVIDATGDVLLAGCDEGLLEEIDYDLLGGRDKFIEGGALDCGVATISYATIYAYDGDIYPAGGPRPTTLADFFDVQKFPGRRGMWKNPTINLEIALIADGVPVSEVYDVLNTEEGIDRAFRKLGEIAPHVIWWEAGAQAPQLLADKEVVMTQAWNGRIYNAVKAEGKNFVIVWDGQALDFDYWIIPKGHPEKDLAMKFIEFASRAEVQKNQSRYISYGPTVKETVRLIIPDILKDLPTAPENTKNYFVVDIQFWADRREELTEHFNAWLAQ
jgi:putative spermidine/putrescine transport system substrate-binding protein